MIIILIFTIIYKKKYIINNLLVLFYLLTEDFKRIHDEGMVSLFLITTSFLSCYSAAELVALGSRGGRQSASITTDSS